ncbi:DUF4760 domain-containing protein [Mucilaginibacter aquaedulcis]|uniref:DUF4760 domain-containing protein n=1 Tax=Mucilaginibacter aquaedulcis TaxID=1187081 RepID=UPI0025B418D6|nr:hypothetical protein [Mucilaginibacter aquaedulcis]MDN3549537.1 hypothetical protein [Mucilaginibacter aquaedulcis]
MFNTPHELIDLVFKIIASIAAIVAILQLIEVRKKRLVEMYWKIAEIYATDEQRNARKNVWLLREDFLKKNGISASNDEELIDLYNRDYHNAAEGDNKDIDTSIINRIRFLNQVGVLLNKRLIDQDMLFGLIGIGFEIDYETLKFVLRAHRKEHGTPNMYAHFETTWHQYKLWAKS